jgi:hypothetical protein
MDIDDRARRQASVSRRAAGSDKTDRNGDGQRTNADAVPGAFHTTSSGKSVKPTV